MLTFRQIRHEEATILFTLVELARADGKTTRTKRIAVSLLVIMWAQLLTLPENTRTIAELSY